MPLCIATRIKPGFSRHGRPSASVSKAKRKDIIAQAHIAHVGMFERREIKRAGTVRVFWVESENFAEFDGPNALSAAKDFASMMAKGCTQERTHCFADGAPPPPPEPWRLVEPREIIEIDPTTGRPAKDLAKT